MSAKPKTSVEDIRAAARSLLESNGIEGLSLQAVADAVGVRAPSLYKRFASKGDLLHAVTIDALGQLQAVLEPAARAEDPLRGLVGMANAYRAFAKGNPRTYELMFAAMPPSQDDLDARLALASPLFELLRKLVAEKDALPAARTIVAFLHGFVSMELAGLFRFGGGIDTAFRFGLSTILNGLPTTAIGGDS